MEFNELIKTIQTDLQNEVAFVNKTWKHKKEKMTKHKYSFVRIDWYLTYAIQRRRYHVFNFYKYELFSAIQKEIDHKILDCLKQNFNYFSDIRFI